MTPGPASPWWASLWHGVLLCMRGLGDGIQTWPGTVALGLAVLLVWAVFRAP